ncbi:MAG: ECF transporter S component [Oscillospiraceae bacterium]|nr:ECF transporter S component [Oscillospiraceae bacterium]
MENTKTTKKVDVRRLVFTALMGALSVVLAELLKFKTPFMPGFITFDFSDVPAMLASLTMGPVSGVAVCLIKNVFGCFTTSTGCVGELSNFILSAALVLPAGIITHKSEKISRAVIGCLSGAVIMALISIVSNYFLVFPAYSAAYHMPMDVIVGLFQEILPSVNSLLDCLLIFNMPFTFVKGLCAAIISILLYKKLRPIFSGIYREK